MPTAWVNAPPVVVTRPDAASAGRCAAIALAAPTDSSACACACACAGRPPSEPSTSCAYSELTSEPTIATPSAPETMRATGLVAEAAPVLAAGRAPTTAAAAGAMTQPIESVRPKNQATRARPPVCGCQTVV